MSPNSFLPGQDYGRECRLVIWVCQNQVKRSFAQCKPAASQEVYRTVLALLAQSGLSQVGSVFQSGCMMGCAEQGTTMAITTWGENAGQTGHTQTRFYKNVTPEDVPALLNEVLANSAL